MMVEMAAQLPSSFLSIAKRKSQKLTFFKGKNDKNKDKPKDNKYDQL